MIKAVIIDDEKHARESLKSLLGFVSDNIEVAGMAGTVESGYELINYVKPDLVFLDIMMPPSDGFALLKRFSVPDFEVVFTTAYSEFALRAIKVAAVDYLLKPIIMDDLRGAIERTELKMRQLKKEDSSNSIKLALPTYESLLFISPEDILWAETTEERKTMLKLRDGKEIIVTKTFSEIEEILGIQKFFRVHRSYIINLNCIIKYYSGKTGGFVHLCNGKKIPVASRKKQEFIDRIGL